MYTVYGRRGHEVSWGTGLCCLKTVGSNEVIYFMFFCESYIPIVMLCNLKGAYCQGSLLSVMLIPLLHHQGNARFYHPLHIPSNFSWYRARERERERQRSQGSMVWNMWG
jgi:hypothetical protein